MTAIVAMFTLAPTPALGSTPPPIDYERVLAHPSLMKEFARMIAVTESDAREIELAAFVVLDTSNHLRVVPWDAPEGERTNTWRGEVPPGTIATVHTHPNGWRRPSHKDQQEATRTRLPFLVLTRWDIWVAEPGSDRPRPLLRSENWRDDGYLAALGPQPAERAEGNGVVSSARSETSANAAHSTRSRLLVSDY